MGLVSRQWVAVDWACVLCDRRIPNGRASISANLHQHACPFYRSRAAFFGKTSHHPGLSAHLQLIFGSLRLLVLPNAKIAVESEEICECDGHTVHKPSQRRLTADWLAPRESDYLGMSSKVSSNWLPTYVYIKATRPVLKIFKMTGYFPDRPRTYNNSDHPLKVEICYIKWYIPSCVDCLFTYQSTEWVILFILRHIKHGVNSTGQ